MEQQHELQLGHWVLVYIGPAVTDQQILNSRLKESTPGKRIAVDSDAVKRSVVSLIKSSCILYRTSTCHALHLEQLDACIVALMQASRI